MTIPYEEIQKLAPSAVLELFVLDLTSLGGATFYFHPGTNELGVGVVWDGQTYDPYPVQVEGMEWSGKGVQPRPTITVPNIDGVLGEAVRDFDDLVGGVVTVKRMLAKHLDAVNFAAGNANADPNACWPDEVFQIEQKTSETFEAITFQLASPMDAQGLKLPGRIIQATVCTWKNTDEAICPFVSSCDRRLSTCEANYGATEPLPFGGFPASSRIR